LPLEEADVNKRYWVGVLSLLVLVPISGFALLNHSCVYGIGNCTNGATIACLGPAGSDGLVVVFDRSKPRPTGYISLEGTGFIKRVKGGASAVQICESLELSAKLQDLKTDRTSNVTIMVYGADLDVIVPPGTRFSLRKF
jgi:hypothetical protein